MDIHVITKRQSKKHQTNFYLHGFNCSETYFWRREKYEETTIGIYNTES
jgi:hypothetical protein